MRGVLKRARPAAVRTTVLLVEDDALVRKVVSEMLRSLGHEVVAAGTPDTALAAIAGPRQLDLLLTDVVLPGENAPEFAERCRRQVPGLRVVFMSGYADRDVVEGLLARGERFIQKPFSLEELGEVLEAALSRS
jgi:two-component system cell cycle sensor histidine kinase/response regulator CckA